MRPEMLDLITLELRRQREKWGTEFPDRTDDRWLTILIEEVGEAGHAILSGDEKNLREEIVQIAAVCVSWLGYRVPMCDQSGEGPVE